VPLRWFLLRVFVDRHHAPSERHPFLLLRAWGERWHPVDDDLDVVTVATLGAASDAFLGGRQAVQAHLGHSSITVTMDRYTHLFPSDVDALIRRLDDIRARNLAAQTRPNERTRGIEFGGR
jgi:integrase